MPLDYESYANGQNALILSSYMNNDTWGVAADVRYTQLIFSQATIPCPRF